MRSHGTKVLAAETSGADIMNVWQFAPLTPRGLNRAQIVLPPVLNKTRSFSAALQYGSIEQSARRQQDFVSVRP